MSPGARVTGGGWATQLLRTLLIIFVSCAHEENLTAIQHRNEAEAHKAKSEQAAAEYEPGLGVKVPARGPFIDSPSNGLTTYNPTASRLEDADRELRKAAEHLAEARRLEAFEDQACAEIPPPERAACPLLASSVTLVRETTSGLELELKPVVDGRDTLRRLECHLAWSRVNGFERPSCPLFMPGLKLGLRETGISTLRFEGDAGVARALHAQARLLFAPERLEK